MSNAFARAASLVALALSCLCSPGSQAAPYPTKPIRIIVGAGPDLVARILAQRLTVALGQNVVVEQLPGAGGIVAAQTVKNARPDGYTLLFSTATYVAVEAFRPDVSFNLGRDFAPIGKIGDGPAILFANPSLGVKSLADLLRVAKERPGQINCASSGFGTQAHLGCEMLRQYGNVDIVHVPYNGIGPALVDTLSGRAQLLFGFMVSLPYVSDGKLVALAVTGSERISTAPEIPTVAEAGLPQLEYTTWYGLHAPKGTTKAIIERLDDELVKVLAEPDVKAKILANGFLAGSSTPEAFGAFVESQLALWERIVKDTGAKPE